jgi:hypothetical protein
MIKMVTIFKNFFSNHDFFLKNVCKSVINRKEPKLEPEWQFIISAPAPKGNIFLALQLSTSGSTALIQTVKKWIGLGSDY